MAMSRSGGGRGMKPVASRPAARAVSKAAPKASFNRNTLASNPNSMAPNPNSLGSARTPAPTGVTRPTGGTATPKPSNRVITTKGTPKGMTPEMARRKK